MQGESCARVNTAKVVWREEQLESLQVVKEHLQPLRFQGQSFDKETGLYYNRFRYFDPDLGMFISRDPIGLMGGVNTFAYAPNPTGWVDPFGLAKKKGNKECCRNLWEVNKYDKVCTTQLNGTQVKYFRSPVADKNNKKLWWSKDTEGHGNSVWKVMEEKNNKLIHVADADEYGDYIAGKHKGNTGKIMDMKKMQCKKVK